VALHFSGHGIENTPENLGNDFFLTKNKGNILLLEDEQGMSDYFFEDDLKYMVEVSQHAIFEVVFVSSCYSQFAGEVFLNAGAKHVICIRSGERISDKASLRFSRVFYETLFVKNYNVCTSFKIAKEEINKVIGSNEANKFLLLIQPEKSYRSTDSHKCNILSDFKNGGLTSMDHKPLFDSIPSNVEGFVGRQQEMYEIINLLEENRLVSILGPPGIGKTSISRNLANYLRDRNKFNDGIIYVGLRGCETSHMFLTRLCVILRAGCTVEEYQKYGLEKLDSEKEEGKFEHNDEDIKYRGFIVNVLKKREILIVLDNTEDPLECDNFNFVNELNFILEN
jgi:nucleoside-triphosphatase THEP1